MNSVGVTDQSTIPTAQEGLPKLGKGWAVGLLVVFSLGFTCLGLIQAARDAPTVDEAVNVAAGVVAATHRDVRMNPEHGLLHRVLPGLSAVAFADPIVPQTAAFDDGDWFDYTDDFISANDEAERLGSVLFWFRIVPLLAAVATGVLLFVVGSRLTTVFGGLVAAVAWLGTPYVLGLAHLSSLDITFSLAVVAVAYGIERLARRPRMARVLALGALVGAALLVRHSAVVIVPIAMIAVAVSLRGRSRRDILAGLALVVLVPVALVWTVYRVVDPTPASGAPLDRFEGMIAAASNDGPVERLALSIPMPVDWKAGFAYLVLTSQERPSYALGRSFVGQPLWYLPANALIKIPATVTLALLAGTAGWWVGRRRTDRAPVVLIGAMAALLALFVVLQPLAFGLRLGVPIFALVALVGSGIAFLPRRLASAAVVVLIVSQAAALVASHPTSLAWTPPPFTDGYRFVSDSSIDFGQANRSVREAHQAEPFAAQALLSPRGYDVLPDVPDLLTLDPANLTGRVAVSATVLSIIAADELSWLRAYCPVEVIDGAVLVYAFDEPPDVSPGPSSPVAPCDGAVSVRVSMPAEGSSD